MPSEVCHLKPRLQCRQQIGKDRDRDRKMILLHRSKPETGRVWTAPGNPDPERIQQHNRLVDFFILLSVRLHQDISVFWYTNMPNFYVNHLPPLVPFQASTRISSETFLIRSLEKAMNNTVSIYLSSFKNIYSKSFVFFNSLVSPSSAEGVWSKGFPLQLSFFNW